MLASASRHAWRPSPAPGLNPQVVVSDVDEDAFTAPDVPGSSSRLARGQGRGRSGPALEGRAGHLVVGCDSLLELDGKPFGKPATAQEAVGRLALGCADTAGTCTPGTT